MFYPEITSHLNTIAMRIAHEHGLDDLFTEQTSYQLAKLLANKAEKKPAAKAADKSSLLEVFAQAQALSRNPTHGTAIQQAKVDYAKVAKTTFSHVLTQVAGAVNALAKEVLVAPGKREPLVDNSTNDALINETLRREKRHLGYSHSAQDLEAFDVLRQAMAYSLISDGKMLRPAIVFIVGKMFGAKASDLLIAGLAVEALHTYSLVHDDLPAMDDDDIRRGKASNHKVFGEAHGILAGDALQTLAFELLSSNSELDARAIVLQVKALAAASGMRGMCLGQSYDLLSEQLAHLYTSEADRLAQRVRLHEIHYRKTAALIAGSTLLGFYAALNSEVLASEQDDYEPVADVVSAEEAQLDYSLAMTPPDEATKVSASPIMTSVSAPKVWQHSDLDGTVAASAAEEAAAATRTPAASQSPLSHSQKSSLQLQQLPDTLVEWAHLVGLAFQIQDDILDVIGDQALIGKPVGSDQASEKLTYVDLVGLEASQAKLGELVAAARFQLDALESQANRYPHALLAELTNFIVERKK